MDDAVILTLVGLTSLGAYLVGARRLGLEARALRAAAGRALECIGLTLVCAVANVALGFAGILVARVLTGGFVSLYTVNDVTLLLLSLLQALVFAWWRADATRPDG